MLNIESRHRLVTPPCFPARPVNGGPLPKALPKSGEWAFEAKDNGWRALIHNPTGAMFNRHLQPLSISDEFAPALAQLKSLPWEWSDTEALERRHGIGRGSLILFDYLPTNDPTETYAQRRRHLETCVAIYNLNHQPKIETHKELNIPIQPNRVYLAMNWRWEGAAPGWPILQQCNKALGCEFFEGIVAKRIDSIYPMQNRSADVDFPFWMKHRWDF
jgi:hypothetical protein